MSNVLEFFVISFDIRRPSNQYFDFKTNTHLLALLQHIMFYGQSWIHPNFEELMPRFESLMCMIWHNIKTFNIILKDTTSIKILHYFKENKQIILFCYAVKEPVYLTFTPPNFILFQLSTRLQHFFLVDFSILVGLCLSNIFSLFSFLAILFQTIMLLLNVSYFP